MNVSACEHMDDRLNGPVRPSQDGSAWGGAAYSGTLPTHIIVAVSDDVVGFHSDVVHDCAEHTRLNHKPI